MQPMNSGDPHQRAYQILSNVAASRGQVYRWLALAFYPPDDEIARVLQKGELIGNLIAATAYLGEDQSRLQDTFSRLAKYSNLSLADLQAGYRRLFGKSLERISIREATYRWRDVTDLVTDADQLSKALQLQYAQYGLDATAGMEDHVAVELEFLAYLCTQESSHWAAQNSITARELRLQQRSFLVDHLGCWLPELSWRIAERAPESFYACMASLGDLWLSLDFGPGYSATSEQR